MIEQLFGSKTRVKLLQLFYSNPNRSFYVREITRKIEEQINSVRRELSNLLSIGIITSDTNNNKLYYEVNQKFEHYAPLAAIFGGHSFNPTTTASVTTKNHELPTKDVAESGSAVSEETNPLIKELRSVGKVDVALLTGQFTRDDSAGIDLLIVGDVNQVKTGKFVESFERQEGRPIRYAAMTTSEYQYRLQVKDRFIYQLLGAKKQVLINDQNLKVEE